MLSASFLIFMALAALGAYIATLFMYEWLGIVFGVLVTLIAIIPHRLGKRNTVLYLLSTSLNAVGIGLSISAYYVVTGTPLTPEAAFLPAAAVCLVFWLLNLLISVFGHKKLFLAAFGALIGLLIVLSAGLWIFAFSAEASFRFHALAPYASFCCFSLILLVFFLFVTGLSLGHPERVALRDVSFGSFGAFVVVTMVVIAIISEGDVVDGFDIADVTKKKKKDVVKR